MNQYGKGFEAISYGLGLHQTTVRVIISHLGTVLPLTKIQPTSHPGSHKKNPDKHLRNYRPHSTQIRSGFLISPLKRLGKKNCTHWRTVLTSTVAKQQHKDLHLKHNT